MFRRQNRWRSAKPALNHFLVWLFSCCKSLYWSFGSLKLEAVIARWRYGFQPCENESGPQWVINHEWPLVINVFGKWILSCCEQLDLRGNDSLPFFFCLVIWPHAYEVKLILTVAQGWLYMVKLSCNFSWLNLHEPKARYTWWNIHLTLVAWNLREPKADYTWSNVR